MSTWRQLSQYIWLISYLGVAMASCVFIGYYLGSLADRYMSTGMFFTVIGIIVGAVSGIYLMYRAAMRAIERQP